MVSFHNFLVVLSLFLIFLIREVRINPGPEGRHSGLETIRSAICARSVAVDSDLSPNTRRREDENWTADITWTYGIGDGRGTREAIQIFDVVAYLPKPVSNLQSALDETETVPWFSAVLGVGGAAGSVTAVPHPTITADWSTCWSGSALAGGRQTGTINLVRATGASSVRMAMSLA